MAVDLQLSFASVLFTCELHYVKILEVSMGFGDVFLKPAAWCNLSLISLPHHRRMDPASAALSEGLDPSKPSTYAAYQNLATSLSLPCGTVHMDDARDKKRRKQSDPLCSQCKLIDFGGYICFAEP